MMPKVHTDMKAQHDCKTCVAVTSFIYSPLILLLAVAYVIWTFAVHYDWP